MTRSGLCAAGAVVLASLLSAHATGPGSRPAPAPGALPPPGLQTFCYDCHGTKKPEAGLSIQKLVSDFSIAAHWEQWEKVAEMLETEVMPPVEADHQPTDDERRAIVSWIRDSIKEYETVHAGDPGRVTVRRLTSAEYAFVIRDLTGVDIRLPIDASGESVGGEGFANLGDVQFVQEESVERYLEAAKLVADHAVIGAGPLEFFTDPGRTGLELSALHRINELYTTRGFRVVSGEGGRPFGLERYAKALYAAWHFKHRAALGEPDVTLADLAGREGITSRFAQHVWTVVNRAAAGYPARETIAGWSAIPPPASDVQASVMRARAACDEIQKDLTTWPSWFFARGDLAAGGAGDESPLAFDDTSLSVSPSHRFTYRVGARGVRARGGPSVPGTHTVHLLFDDVLRDGAARPAVIWRNARIVTRAVVVPAEQATAAAASADASASGRDAGAVLTEQSLRVALGTGAEALAFGTSPDGSKMGPDDFATNGPVSFSIEVPPGQHIVELHADAELGRDRDAVVRLMLSERPEGTSRDAPQRVVLGDPASRGYRTFRANMDEYVALLPPNSHGEANPADKDPVPAPFDNTYNSREHDAFVLKVKYQRNDRFFTENMVDGADRARLNHAWHDLFGSWPYHDAYLGMLAEHFELRLESRRVADLSPAVIAAQPAAAQPYLSDLRAHYDEVTRAFADAEPGHLSDVLAFGERAWRRPLTAGETASLQAFYRRSRSSGLEHDAAIRAVLARILVAPSFLYRVETLGRGAEEAPLDDWELASRLSFFLWASIPDAELRRAAAAGELRTPSQLARQTARMAADPKARRLATEFFGQWLGFYRFDEYRGVDTTRFPEFTDEIRTSMYEEAVTTFEHIVRQRRPVKEILHAEYAFLNKPLAAFYGIDAPAAADDSMVKVDGAARFHRGGALRLGSVLTTTSAPLRTSPVKRGDWVLRRVLGTPTPPPPADAGTLPGDDKSFNGLTLRQRLEEHKRNATCASCHQRIDPLGFPLEAFDPVGRRRDAYPDGQAVDVTGELPGRTLTGDAELLAYLRTRDDQVLKTLSRKMLGYALGRTALASDRPLLAEMSALGADASFTDMAVAIVTSRQFRNHAGDTGAPGEPPPAPIPGRAVAHRSRPLPAGTR